MKQISVLFGATRYEFWMQIRRRSMWVTLIIMSLFMTGIIALVFSKMGGIAKVLSSFSSANVEQIVVDWACIVNVLLPIGVGCLLTDRFIRERRQHTDEILTTLPAALSARLAGKYLGSTLATIIPVILFYCLGLVLLGGYLHTWLVIPWGIAAFATITLPGLCFVASFSIACPAAIWAPLYQFLFTGYWFWGNLLNPHRGIPSISGTILTPIGGYAARGIFNPTYGLIDYATDPTLAKGIESILLLLGLAVVAQIALWGLLKWRQAHA
ncbi:hypothetical protein [Tengunoibacter tsumagoiensis]|uniref:Uncharacterized protein n=1 Tax=Tengunoibacter tsumagoiensis TaxID=2014871 RepID=A0A401ZX41_9CHLR|nr:hypothetical protein [Tengunoibacter tsumagoiensis]GCE11344.1 hypothetical protein KTT_12030 [Tengunoibacter tsumagoiensis]